MTLASSLHYLYEASEENEKRRFVYFCAECECILNVSAELEPVELTVESLGNRCPGCGASLQSSISCRSRLIPDAWSQLTRSTHSMPRPKKLRTTRENFRSAASMRGFSFGLAPLDRLVGCIDPGWLVALTGDSANAVAELVCFRAQLPRVVGGLDSSAVLIDGGNRSDLYLFSSFAKLHGVPAKRAMRRVVTSRSFTMYQLADLVAHGLPRVVEDYGAEMVVVSDALGMLEESQLNEEEAKRVTDAIGSGMLGVVREKRVFGFVTLLGRTEQDSAIVGRADVVVGLERDGSHFKGVLVKHPYREGGSAPARFRLCDLRPVATLGPRKLPENGADHPLGVRPA